MDDRDYEKLLAQRDRLEHTTADCKREAAQCESV